MKKEASVATMLALWSAAASAADVASKKAEAAPPRPASWLDTLTIDGYVEGGITVNPDQPFNRLNFGQLYTDRANTPTFDGLLVTAQRPLDPKATDYDFGFKLQLQLGQDMRYNHYYGLLDYAIHSGTQFGPTEAHVLAHLPWVTPLSEGGVDIKIGNFGTYNGAELLVATDAPLYSHSYIFNFGPFIHTGVMVTTHVRSWLDIYTGVTSGVNTSVGWPGDNNNASSVYGGFGLNLLDGEVTVMAMVHHGPENPKQLDPLGVGWTDTSASCACDPNTANRTYANIVTTWKATENLTFTTDIAYDRESGWNTISTTGLPATTLAALDANFGTNLSGLPQKPQGADGYAIAQYVSYKLDEVFKLNARVEYYRDNKNFFIVGFPGYFDLVNLGHGFPCPSCIFAGPGNVGTSYFALTAGLTITPELPELPVVKGLILRPEARWDTSLDGTQPFFGPNGRKSSQGLLMLDVIVPFSLI
jgi:hypothetical protein